MKYLSDRLLRRRGRNSRSLKLTNELEMYATNSRLKDIRFQKILHLLKRPLHLKPENDFAPDIK